MMLHFLEVVNFRFSMRSRLLGASVSVQVLEKILEMIQEFAC
jgi:hypothetical protein